jgi:hypothetical protein
VIGEHDDGDGAAHEVGCFSEWRSRIERASKAKFNLPTNRGSTRAQERILLEAEGADRSFFT